MYICLPPPAFGHDTQVSEKKKKVKKKKKKKNKKGNDVQPPTLNILIALIAYLHHE